MSRAQTFDEFFTTVYLPQARARKRSWALDERLAWRNISPTFGGSALGAIAPVDVQAWLCGLRRQGLAPSSCNRILAILKSVFALAISTGQMAWGSSPCREVRNFKVVNARERFLSREEGKRLLASLAGIDRPEARIISLLLTGARKSEILKARWENLDGERRILTVPVSKSGKPRYIYLSEEEARIFRSMSAVSGSPWIFPGRNPAKPLSDVYRFWNRIRQELGMKDARLHDLRHSFASYLVSDGHTLYVTQQLLGHSDPRTTMCYAHFAQNTLIAATATLDDLFRKCADSGKKIQGSQRKGNQGGHQCQKLPRSEAKMRKIRICTKI